VRDLINDSGSGLRPIAIAVAKIAPVEVPAIKPNYSFKG